MTGPAAPVTNMTGFWARCRGAGGTRPAHPSVQTISLAGLGGCLAIGVVAVLSARLDVLLLLGSFGASCVLVFGYPDAAFAQPANVFFGHVICTSIGLAALHFLNNAVRKTPYPHYW